ncbi:tyrosine-type recombinase/integrase [Eubacteriales bacterium OttesenSCG-928-G02]|nr:tyrosine-type recombinase/integrase [Eubacteriales bacterium OttesenSCG-928-G02]
MPNITKRNNTYRIKVSCGYDMTGRQITRSTTWTPSPNMTEKQIKKELDRQAFLFEEKCRSGQFLDGSIKFADFAEYYMTEYAEKQLRPSTVTGYKFLLVRINAAIGHIRLDKLQPRHLMEFYKNLSECNVQGYVPYVQALDMKQYLKKLNITQTELAKRAGINVKSVYALLAGNNISFKIAEKISFALNVPFDKLFIPVNESGKKLSDKTVLHHHRLISAICEKAVKWQVILYNPCQRVETPKTERKEAKYLDEKQAAQLLTCLQNEPLQYRAIITLLIYSGLRRGELCGLEWSDIDFENSVIDINKSSLYLKEKGIFEDRTKNTTSNRVIKLPLPAMEVLKEHKRVQHIDSIRMGDRWINSNKIFTQWDGKPIHPCTVSSWFYKFIKKYDLPAVSVHSLRHTNATLLIAGGTDIRTVSKRLGHADTTTTMNIYTHAIQTADERAAELLTDILNPTHKAEGKQA